MFQFGKNASESRKMLQQVYGDDALSCSCILKWFWRFLECPKSVNVDPHSGLRISVFTSETIKKVRDLVTSDRWLTIRPLSDELDINKEAVRQSLTKDSGKCKVCTRFKPYCLWEEQKQMRLACKEIIDSQTLFPFSQT